MGVEAWLEKLILFSGRTDGSRRVIVQMIRELARIRLSLFEVDDY